MCRAVDNGAGEVAKLEQAVETFCQSQTPFLQGRYAETKIHFRSTQDYVLQISMGLDQATYILRNI